MKQYGIKCYEIEDNIETEIEINDLPDNYIAGLIKTLKDELIRRERLDKVYRGIAERIGSTSE